MAWSQIPFRMLEAYLVARLLQSQQFHRMVRGLHHRIKAIRDPTYREATRAPPQDATGIKLYFQLFRDEFRKSEWGRVFRR